MPQIHTKQIFEKATEHELLTFGGYIKDRPVDFDRDMAIDKPTSIRFLKQSQLKQWEKLQSIHYTNTKINVIKGWLESLNSEVA